MIRKPHRVNFRLTPEEYARYGGMIYPLPTAVPGCWSWTRLVLKALEELYQFKQGRNFPLATAPFPDSAEKTSPRIDQESSKPVQAMNGTAKNGAIKPPEGGRREEENGAV